MKKRFSLKIVAATGIVTFLLGAGITQLVSGDPFWDQMNKLKDVLVILDKFYVEPVDLKKITESGIESMLKELDPHSVYIPPRTFERVTEETEGKYQGVGLQIVSSNDTIMVVEPIGGGPAQRLGILTNDRIVQINDTSIIKLNVTEASKRLRGPKGTKVKVTIRRLGVAELLTYEITRDEISLFTIETSIMVDKQTGYIAVNKFGMQTHQEMERALEKLKSQGMKQLILDLRGNPGGILDESVKMTDLFLDEGTKEKPKHIVYTKARQKELEEEYFATAGQPYERLPLIILIDNASASASEIVSGAIQDWDRGLIVGETSFGKGLVQRQWTLSDGSALRVTIARYYTPTGRLIQRTYKGKDSDVYRREAFTRNEEEGENIEHEKDTTSANDTTRLKYKTLVLGRTVLGGGGITPDYVIKPGTLTDQTMQLFRRDLFYQFMRGYMDGAASLLTSQYGKDVQDFVKSYEVPQILLTQFKEFCGKNNVTIKDEDFQKDIVFIKTRLKAYTARHLWSNEGWYNVVLSTDPVFKKAVKLFPEAVKLARLK